MQLNEDTPLTQLLVTRYQDDTIWVHDQPYNQSIILTPTKVVSWNGDLDSLLHYDAKLILIGAKDYIQMNNPETLAFFYEKNIGVEIMSLQAACRTYNLLVNEGREVIAGLIM